ncbi:hypothetical protein ES702_01909 [subsurface metagenome]
MPKKTVHCSLCGKAISGDDFSERMTKLWSHRKRSHPKAHRKSVKKAVRTRMARKRKGKRKNKKVAKARKKKKRGKHRRVFYKLVVKEPIPQMR